MHHSVCKLPIGLTVMPWYKAFLQLETCLPHQEVVANLSFRPQSTYGLKENWTDDFGEWKSTRNRQKFAQILCYHFGHLVNPLLEAVMGQLGKHGFTTFPSCTALRSAMEIMVTPVSTQQHDAGLEINLKVVHEIGIKHLAIHVFLILSWLWNTMYIVLPHSHAINAEIQLANAWGSASRFAMIFMSGTAAVIGENLEFKNFVQSWVHFPLNK